MPVIIPKELPANKVLRNENVVVIDKERAEHQDIRPLNVALVNLMPTKIATETQFTRLLSGSPIQINLDFVYTTSYTPKHISMEHLTHFYKGLDEIKSKKYDAIIVTGAPVENLPFEEVDYWEEMKEILDFTVTNCTCSMYICWGAQAALYHFYGVEKKPLPQKMFGVFPHQKLVDNNLLLNGFDDIFYAPHSRHTYVEEQDIINTGEVKILAKSHEAGVHIAATDDFKKIFIMGHGEYDRDTLKYEYERDVSQGKKINIPKNYFPNDDTSKEPYVCWQGAENLLFKNFVNLVYQITPYDIDKIGKERLDS